MTGVDTNILVRLFITEEPHSAKAIAFFKQRSSSDPAFVSLVVMAEFVWVLKKKYKQNMAQISTAIQSLLDSDDFIVEHWERAEWALAHYTSARIDFSDLLIARSGALAGAAGTATFDVDAAKLVPGMELLK
jgi:predicted nucleic-acid-binding protein